jgi:hypothetical protein
MFYDKWKFMSVLLAALLACTGTESFIAVLCAGGPKQSAPAENGVPTPQGEGRYFTLPDGRTVSSQRGRSFTDTTALKSATPRSPDYQASESCWTPLPGFAYWVRWQRPPVHAG